MVCKASIILTYQHTEERLPLFYACLTSLYDRLGNRVEYCIHEVGEERVLFLPDKYKYLFTRYKGIYHRAWALNRCVKKLATTDKYVLMDSDLVVTSEWAKEVLSSHKQSIAWGILNYLNSQGTKTFLRTKTIDRQNIERTKTPAMGGAAGAAMIVPRNLFYSVSGIPEDFMGSWGGEDNAFWAKITALGHPVKRFKSSIYHLYHSKSTPRDKDILSKIKPMLHWRYSQWTEYVKFVGNSWGLSNPESYKTPTIEKISEKTDVKLTFAMLSWLRYEKLINTLKTLKEILTIPVNVCLMVQGRENLKQEQRREVRWLVDQFEGSDVFFTKGNIGTGPARKMLVDRALNRFYTPYINLADDDTTYTSGSVEAVIDFLDSNLSVGVAGIRYKPKVYKLNSQIHPFDILPTQVRKSIEDVDCTGSASAFIRREIFDLCKIDDFYRIGYWDLDLFLQVRSLGWRIVNCELFEGMRAINSWGGCKEYRKARVNKTNILISRQHFKKRWNLRKTV